MKAKEFLDCLINNLTLEDTNVTKFSESLIDKQVLSEKINSDKVTYLLTEFDNNYNIRKKNAAKITHVVIHDILGIPDEEDPEKLKRAENLKDLYDCRVCVNDITQMYVREIMEASCKSPVLLFGSENLITEDDAKNIACRIISFANKERS